jgi:hypothetical protein
MNDGMDKCSEDLDEDLMLTTVLRCRKSRGAHQMSMH